MPTATHCLAAAADLERVDVSAAMRGVSPGDLNEPASDFPGLAWLPEKLGKSDLLVRWLTVEDPVSKDWLSTNWGMVEVYLREYGLS